MIWKIRSKHIRLSLNTTSPSTSQKIVDLYQRLLPRDPFQDKPVLGSIGTHGAVLGNLGSAYSALGQVEKAIFAWENLS
jgi:hypothetical protein